MCYSRNSGSYKSSNFTTPIRPMNTLSYYILLFLIKAISYIPFKVLYILSDILYYPLYSVVRYRRKIVRKNLTESFPDKSMREIIRIEKKFYHFFIDMALESCKLSSISPEKMKRRMKFTNIEIINEKVRESKSFSAFLGHYGNWEWISSIGLWISKEAVVSQIYHPLRNRSMDKIMKTIRERMGNICVEMHKTARFMANAAKGDRPQAIGFIADQSPKKRDANYFIPFLNHMVPVLTGTEKVIKHYDYEAMFISVKRIKRGYYECELSFLHPNPKSLPDYELTSIYFNRLEQDIRQQPELYLWSHNRFRHAQKPSPINHN